MLTTVVVSVVVACVLVPGAFALVRRPQLGVLALVALAPFDGLLALVPVPALANAWKEALVVATLGATFVCPAAARARRDRPLPGWAPAVLGFLGLGVLSALVVGGDQAVYGLKIGFFYLLAALAVWRCPLGARDRDRLVTVLMTVGVVVAVIGLGQQVLGHARLAQLGFEYDEQIRFAGNQLRSFATFEQPFPFALFLMIVVLLGLAHALDEPRRVRNVVFLVSLPVLLLALTATFVRAGWLGLGFGLLYLGFKRHRILLAGIPFALVAFVFVGSSITGPLLSSSSLEARTRGWDANIEQVRLHPLGVGIGSSGAVAETLQEQSASDIVQGTTYQPDSFYFKTLYELGVLGLWMVVLLFASVLVACHRSSRVQRGRDRSLVEGVTATVVAAIFASFVATYFEIFPLDLLFWILVAVVAAMDEPGAEPSVTGEPDRRVLVGS